MTPTLAGAVLLLFGLGMAVFARSAARSNLAGQDTWLHYRSQRVRQRYEVSAERRRAREDLLTGVFVVAGVGFAVLGLLLALGVVGDRG